MKGKAFTTLGALLIIGSVIISIIELNTAIHGSAAAWMRVSALICVGVLGVGMVRVGASPSEEDA